MTPYLDADFLLHLLLRTRETERATHLLREIDGPVVLNYLHQLQAENLLMRQIRSPDPASQEAGHAGLRLWNQYHAEAVFAVAEADWDAAYLRALGWNRNHPGLPPPPLLLFHPALAASAGATHFLSFEPRSRAMAQRAGLKLLPAQA